GVSLTPHCTGMGLRPFGRDPTPYGTGLRPFGRDPTPVCAGLLIFSLFEAVKNQSFIKLEPYFLTIS
ncbi:MAG: hypothetical protein IJK84_04185, partial [Bacteroidales bacterium]|nr:hypothetical protein [Bacteroidales bacterium]